MGMRFLDRVFGALGLRAEQLTEKQLKLVKQAAQDIDCTGHPDLQAAQRAQLLWDAGRLDEALDQFALAILHAPQDAILWLNRGNLQFQMGRFHDALDSFESAEQLDPTMDPVLLVNARMIRTLGGPDSPTLVRMAARKAVLR
ncbi:MAG: tetratricopeptide repeat protein [Prosthecobacter sp.]